MNKILNTPWSASVISAIFGAMIITVLGFLIDAPPAATLFAAAIFGALLVWVVQLSYVLFIIVRTRGTEHDVGATIIKEVESPTGHQELKHMDFTSLLTVAVIQELYTSLYLRDRPIWAFEFLGVGGDFILAQEYGALNRYVEWTLMIGLFCFTLVSAILGAFFVYTVTVPVLQSSGMTFAACLCVIPTFLLGGLFAFTVGLFIASVIRRVFILYSTRADDSKLE